MQNVIFVGKIFGAGSVFLIVPDSSGCADIGDMRDLIGFNEEAEDGCAERQICVNCMKTMVEAANKIEPPHSDSPMACTRPVTGLFS